MIRVLVVDNSYFMRRLISDILAANQEIEVVGQAADGIDALEKVRQLHPDVVSLDYQMPKMNGLATLQKIMEMSSPSRVVMVSAYTEEGADITIQCLEEGAIDFVLKPSGEVSLDMQKVGVELINKIIIAAKIDASKVKILKAKHTHTSTPEHTVQGKVGVVVIGSSTGGPVALENILPQFPPNFPYPILVAQHLPARFTLSFAQRLASFCQLDVHEAKDNEKIMPGVIYISPGDADTEVVMREHGDLVFSIKENTKDILTPSVDKLMISAAQLYKDGTIGVILTGMGKDGLLGMQNIKACGGKTFVQNADSAIVFGMGKEVVDAGLADEVLPLEKIVPKILGGTA